MVEGDLDSAEAVTHRRYAETQEDGSVMIKQVLERLDITPPLPRSEPMKPQGPDVTDDFNNDHMGNRSPRETTPPRRSRVSLRSFVNT
jgi:hypothetical protein